MHIKLISYNKKKKKQLERILQKTACSLKQYMNNGCTKTLIIPLEYFSVPCQYMYKMIPIITKLTPNVCYCNMAIRVLSPPCKN